jgi:hypothetical protein
MYFLYLILLVTAAMVSPVLNGLFTKYLKENCAAGAR